MSIKSIISTMCSASLITLSTAGCSGVSDAMANPSGRTEAFSDSFETFDTGSWNTANWTNGSMFNCGWLPDHVAIQNSTMKLTLDDTPSHEKDYSGGEYRTNEKFGYGKFEVRMKPAKCDGIVSSFFLYTENPWDEIDIEFLGKDTTKVQFNFFVNGTGNHEFLYTLGFDASTEFHTYAFEWLPDCINWYVDDVIVHTVTDSPRPTHSMQIMMNLWPGIGVDSWLKKFTYPGTPLEAEYDYVQFTPADNPAE